jgi:HlyD family secretion protein
MFRVKIQVPPELVVHYVERIKTGVRGVGYVKTDDAAVWPEFLEKGLINSPTTGSAPVTPAAAAPAASSKSK